MFKGIIYFILTITILVFVDLLWLGIISKNLYRKEIGHLMADNFKLLPAILFYFLYSLGIIIFVIKVGIDNNSLKTVLVLAAFFGIVSYGTYDLINWASLKNWPAKIVLIDMLWGAFITSLVSSIVFLISKILH